jgi:hypothetical protein
MSPAEKRYFKRHYGSDTNTLTHLFDAINLQKEYNEAEIKAKMTGKAAENLKVYKFQLEQLILQSLISHQHFSTLEHKVRGGLAHFDILLEKGLPEMAKKQLEKTRALCLKTNYLSYLPIILEKEAKLQYLLTGGFSAPESPTFRTARETLPRLHKHQDSLSHLYRLMGVYLEQTLPLSETQLRHQHNGLATPVAPSDQDPKQNILDRIANSILWAILGEYQKAVQELYQVLPEMKKQKYHHQLPDIYLFALRCAVESSLKTRDYPHFSHFNDEGLLFSKKRAELAREFFYFATYELRYLIGKDQPFSAIQKALKKHQKQAETLNVNPDIAQTIYFSWICITGLIHQEYILAKTQVEKLAQIPQEAVDFAPALSQFLSLIIEFEKPNHRALAQLYRNIKVEHNLSLARAEKRLYSAFLQFFGDLIKVPQKGPDLARDLLKEIETQEKTPFHRVFQQVNLHKWLTAIVKEEPYIAQLEYH